MSDLPADNMTYFYQGESRIKPEGMSLVVAKRFAVQLEQLMLSGNFDAIDIHEDGVTLTMKYEESQLENDEFTGVDPDVRRRMGMFTWDMLLNGDILKWFEDAERKAQAD